MVLRSHISHFTETGAWSLATLVNGLSRLRSIDGLGCNAYSLNSMVLVLGRRLRCGASYWNGLLNLLYDLLLHVDLVVGFG